MSGGVTWGNNTVHTIGGVPAPSAFSFGAPAPAPSAFGAPAPSAFGAPAPSVFGAPAPSAFGAPAPSAFGASAPAPAAGGFGFGSTTTPAAGGGLFGTPAPAPIAFGSFAQPQQPHVPQHYIPAQAAMEASLGMMRMNRELFFRCRRIHCIIISSCNFLQ